MKDGNRDQGETLSGEGIAHLTPRLAFTKDYLDTGAWTLGPGHWGLDTGAGARKSMKTPAHVHF